MFLDLYPHIRQVFYLSLDKTTTKKQTDTVKNDAKTSGKLMIDYI